MNTSQRRRLAAVALVGVVPLLSSCASNFGVQTDQVYNPGVGTDNRSGEVDVLNALIVSAKPGAGTVVAGLVNNNQSTDDQLVSVSGADTDIAVKGAVSSSGPTLIPAGGALQLATAGNVSVTGADVSAGNFVHLKFVFQDGTAVVLNCPVVPNTGEFTNVPVPAAS